MACALLGTRELDAQAKPVVAGLDVQSYRLELRIDPGQRQLGGTATLVARVVAAGNRVALDLDAALQVSAVQWQGRALEFAQAQHRLLVSDAGLSDLPVGRELELVVTYSGSPRVAVEPPWRGGFVWAATADGRPWLAQVGALDGGRLWFPCQDEPRDLAQFELRVAVPKGLVAASCGVRQGDAVVVDDQQVWHWRTVTPLLPAQLTVAVGPFTELNDSFRSSSGTTVPVQWFVLPAHAATARQRLPRFLDQLRVFEALFGQYPYAHEKYGLVEVPHPGAAHPNLLAYGGGWRDEQFDAMHCALLAQSWWGNQLVVAGWQELWLQEGFAAYAQLLYREARFGAEAYWKELWRLRTVDRAPLLPGAPATMLEMRRRPGGLAELQHKGARVLQMLRWHLGDERFFGLLVAWARRGDGAVGRRLVATADFAAHCREFSGEDLGWFFAAYLQVGPLPTLSAERRAGVLHLQWQVEASPTAGAFALEVPVRVGAQVHRVAMAGGRGELRVDDREYTIDPDAVLLAGRGPGVR